MQRFNISRIVKRDSKEKENESTMAKSIVFRAIVRGCIGSPLCVDPPFSSGHPVSLFCVLVFLAVRLFELTLVPIVRVFPEPPWGLSPDEPAPLWRAGQRTPRRRWGEPRKTKDGRRGHRGGLAWRQSHQAAESVRRVGRAGRPRRGRRPPDRRERHGGWTPASRKEDKGELFTPAPRWFFFRSVIPLNI